MSDTPVAAPVAPAPAEALAPEVVPTVTTAPRPSVFRRVLARVSAAEAKLIHDPIVDKAGKALVAALVIRGLVALGAGAGVVTVAEHVLHAAGI